MKSHSLHVRVKVIALLVSMTALWVFAAVVTLREGMNLLFVNTLDTGVGRPTLALVDALQEERKLSAMVLGGSGQADALVASRGRTDQALSEWRQQIADTNLGLAASDQLKAAIDDASRRLDGLVALRESINSRQGVDRTQAGEAFTALIDAGFRIYGSISSLDDQEIAQQSRTLIAMSQARELLSQEDALISGALVADTVTAQDITAFTKLVGAQRFLYASTVPNLPPEDRALYEQAVTGPAVERLRKLEDDVMRSAGSDVPFAMSTWQQAIDPAARALRDVELAAADHTIERATPVAVGVIVRLVLAGGLGLLAVVAAIIISITTARRLVQQLEKLRDAARDLSENRLPQVVDRLSQGQEVDVAAEAPPLTGFGNDEIGQVGTAFNAVQETAIHAAVQQAELRRGVRDVFLSLARRTQNLVHKQLGLLDGMERRADPDEMEELFRIDHLATRMRRSAENLIVLSGASPGRMWRRPVPMIDVIRGALGEVEEYTRVTLLPIDPGALTGRAVGDVIHLLAELIENAVSYSPPYTGVNVSGQSVANGFVVEVEDRGLGMNDDDLRVANEQLADPPDFSLADASRLGHYVVAKLAERHGIKVHLRQSPYGGTAAIILIPSGLMVTSDDAVASATTDVLPPIPAQPGAHRREAPPPQALDKRQSQLPPLPQRTPVADSVERALGGTVAVQTPGEANGATVTPAGLPWRVRQASLAPQLRHEPPPADEPVVEEEAPARDPELIRRMMRSYQHGTERGRSQSTNDSDTATTGPPDHGEVDRGVAQQASKEHFDDRQEG